jgi:hypothetical protein
LFLIKKGREIVFTSKQENNKEQANGRQRDEGALMPRITAIFLKKNYFLTLEDGRWRPKHVVF